MAMKSAGGRSAVVDDATAVEHHRAHAAVFHALGEPTRLALLTHLGGGEHRVRDLVEHMHLAQSTVSKHLACLLDCGLVARRTEGRASWFSITDQARLTSLVRTVGDLMAAGGAPTAHDHDAVVAGGAP